MSFRTRLLIVFALFGLVPIVLLAFVVRNEMTMRLTQQYVGQVNEQVASIRQDLDEKNQSVERSLENMGRLILDDNRFRAALIDRGGLDRQYVLGYMAARMGLVGLSMLQLQDDKGRILSSGHFQYEFDRIEKELPALLQEKDITIIEARSPEGFFDAIAQVKPMSVGNATYYLIGGIRIDSSFVSKLTRSSELDVIAQFPDQDVLANATSSSGDRIISNLSYPYIAADRAGVSAVNFVITHNQSGLRELRASVDRWFLILGGVAVLFAIAAFTWIANRISRPIEELSQKTALLDLDRLDVNFYSNRDDEVGKLSRLLNKLAQRLRKSTVLIKDAERRAAMGDLARQVNHDIKNGLTPLRNVFRHLSQLADTTPQEIPAVFVERKETVASSIDYLQGLATSYARLTPRADRIACDLNAMIEQVVKDKRSLSPVSIQTRLSKDAIINADPLSLRRIIENLVDNAIESLPDYQGKVSISTERLLVEREREKIRLVIADTGIGMSEEQKGKVFQDFYTTKDKGTGLGLSIVRRLVMDLDGSIRVESTPGKGTQFILDLPML